MRQHFSTQNGKSDFTSHILPLTALSILVNICFHSNKEVFKHGCFYPEIKGKDLFLAMYLQGNCTESLHQINVVLPRGMSI